MKRARLDCIDLQPDQLRIVRDALQRYVPKRKVLVFGSRARRDSWEFSDLDLAVMGDELIPLSVSAALDEALSESDLPFKVDVVDWALTELAFRKIIMRHAITIQEAASTRLDPVSK